MILIERITQKKGRKILIPVLKEVTYDSLPPSIREGIAGRPITECPNFNEHDFQERLIRLMKGKNRIHYSLQPCSKCLYYHNLF